MAMIAMLTTAFDASGVTVLRQERLAGRLPVALTRCPLAHEPDGGREAAVSGYARQRMVDEGRQVAAEERLGLQRCQELLAPNPVAVVVEHRVAHHVR